MSLRSWLTAGAVAVGVVWMLGTGSWAARPVEVDDLTSIRGGCVRDCLSYNCRWPEQVSGCKGTLIGCDPEDPEDCTGLEAIDDPVHDCAGENVPPADPCLPGLELDCGPYWGCTCFWLPGAEIWRCSGADSPTVYFSTYRVCNRV